MALGMDFVLRGFNTRSEKELLAQRTILSSRGTSRRANSASTTCSNVTSCESNLAIDLFARFICRRIWQNVAWNQRAYFNGFPCNYDQRDLHIIARRVARRVVRRKMGS